MTNAHWTDRGQPWDYDRGPPRNRSWARLFAETPNYRGLGLAVTGREAFRWHFGPMFYRGRLSDDGVKVLVIGQEGAQDESLAARSFVGGTGSRMQHLLTHLGITSSYLFLNTFVYPIFGQYNAQLRLLGQHPASPIVRHRHEILDYVLARNDVRLVIAVGTAAKESVVTWVRAHGGVGSDVVSDVSRCDPTVLGPRVKLIGVLHPGGAAMGGATQVIADFKRAINQISRWVDDDPSWLPADPGGMLQPAGEYKYRSAPIPFRDLPFGTTWRLGRGATTSNRKDGQRSIQIFGAGGSYNNSGDKLTYPSVAGGDDEGYAGDDGDLSYEPPRRHWKEFDPGPPPSYARLLQGGAPGLAWPDFGALGAAGDGSFGPAGMYRGRFTDVKALVIADEHAHDDLFCARALTGDAGQHLQGVLDAMGITHDYLIVRPLPIDTVGLSASTTRAMVDHPAVRGIHTELVDRLRARNPDLGVVLAVGPNAQRLVKHLPLGPLPVIELKAWSTHGARADWRRALERLADLPYATDSTPTFEWDGRRRQIPRHDLPYGSLRWRGSSGDRAVTAHQNGKPTPHYRKLFMPTWAAQLPAAPLTPAEQAAVAALLA